MAHGPPVYRLQDGPAFLFDQFHILPLAAGSHFFRFFRPGNQQKDMLVVDVDFALRLLLHSSIREHWKRLIRRRLLSCVTSLSLPGQNLFRGQKPDFLMPGHRIDDRGKGFQPSLGLAVADRPFLPPGALF